MFNISLGENSSLPSSLNQLYGCANGVIRDCPIPGRDAGVDRDALEWSIEVMNYTKLAGTFFFLSPKSEMTYEGTTGPKKHPFILFANSSISNLASIACGLSKVVLLFPFTTLLLLLLCDAIWLTGPSSLWQNPYLNPSTR